MMLSYELIENGEYRAEDPRKVTEYCAGKMGVKEGSPKWYLILDHFKNTRFTCTEITDTEVTLHAMSGSNTMSVLTLNKEDMLLLFDLCENCDLSEDEWNNVEDMKHFGDITVCWLTTGEKGVARLKDGDRFDVATGHRVAYSKALIKRYQKSLREEKAAAQKEIKERMENLQKFERRMKKSIRKLQHTISIF